MPTPNAQAEWLTPKTAARYIESTYKTLENWRYRGIGPRFSVINRRIRYRRADLDAWMEANIVETQKERAEC